MSEPYPTNHHKNKKTMAITQQAKLIPYISYVPLHHMMSINAGSICAWMGRRVGVGVGVLHNFIWMASQDRFKKNQSMNSTHHMSCNHSHATNFYSDCRSPLLNYAHIPMPKDPARWNQSAATWRHTAHNHTFSRDSRFKDHPAYYSDILEPQLPSSLTSKSCTFGKGTRKPISAVILRNAKEKPAPDRYDMTGTDEQPRQPAKGKTFGLGWKHYERNYIQHRSDAYAEFHSEHNPSAKYEVREVPGGNKRKFTAYGRLKMYSSKMADDKTWVPGPYHKVDDRRLYGTVGLNDRNFSFGERIDLSKPANENPEAIYHVPGFTEKFTKIRHKNERNTSSRV